jgi:hypothetical protein
MADAATTAVAKLDGRDPDAPNYPPLSYTGVTAYQEWAAGHSWVNRPNGSDPGKTPGEEWWSTSDVDHTTWLAEVMTKKYHGQTAFQMLVGLFAVMVEGQDPKTVAKKLGLPAKAIPVDVLAKQDVTPIQPAS